jgi:two-component system cell cycle response regulator DivK
MRVLVIDDDASTRARIADELTGAGYVVATAANGEDGLEEAMRFRPDAIVLDLVLPELSGFSVARIVRALESLRSVPIVAVSGLVSGPLREEALAAGCDVFLAKPVAAARVLERLELLLTARGSKERAAQS